MKMVAQGDEESLGVLINRYQKKLLRFISSLGKISLQDAEDILQESFIKVYVNAKGFDASLSFSAWVYRIARNSTYSWMRSMRARPHIVISVEDVEILLKSTENMAETMDSKIKLEKVKEVIESLPNKYREVLWLQLIDEKDYQEISDILKIPKSTVATRLSRAKKKLQQWLI